MRVVREERGKSLFRIAEGHNAIKPIKGLQIKDPLNKPCFACHRPN